MSDLFGNHIVGFPTRRLKYIISVSVWFIFSLYGLLYLLHLWYIEGHYPGTDCYYVSDDLDICNQSGEDGPDLRYNTHTGLWCSPVFDGNFSFR